MLDRKQDVDHRPDPAQRSGRVRVQLGRAVAGPASGGTRVGATASTSGVSSWESWVFAAEVSSVNGRPIRSTSR
jgi:hypothetical protein